MTVSQSYGDPDLEDDEENSLDEGLAMMVLPHFTAKRHLTGGNPRACSETDQPLDWRLRSRLRTSQAALLICLNIGTPPPDFLKIADCAKLECWVDPSGMRPEKALEEIGKNLQRQFETLAQKVRFKLFLDPAFEDTKKLCHSLRKSAKDERLLFYYNGHGVPAPTASGEIWVFNRTYTQYIPVSLFDLHEWLGSPCIFVWDCSRAGNILDNVSRLAERRNAENRKRASSDKPSSSSGEQPGSSSSSFRKDEDTNPVDGGATSSPSLRDCIQLAACGANETLPMDPQLPADLFTSCLTSPIEIALRYFALQDPLKPQTPTDAPRARVTLEQIGQIPGDLKDRRTPLGELNWIFTSITDTIAWLVLPKDLFRKLFRQDLLVAALFRNFLLATRIMRTYNCTPRSEPELPPTQHHPLWDSWDRTIDACLAQLPNLLKAEASARDPTLPPFQYKYQPSNFYVEHLTALNVWLFNAGVVPRPLSFGDSNTPAVSLVHQERRPPEQLPIVLQVLLSQTHRLRALILLSKFVDLGPWAVRQALDIGIFPYVQRLLLSPAIELRPVLIFIWSRIMAVDKSCQADLLKDNGFAYFSSILSPYQNTNTPLLMSIPNSSEHRAMCAFVLSIFCRDFRPGQQACLASDVFASCLYRMKDDDYLLRQWGPLCIAHLWANNDEAKALGLQLGAPNLLCEMLRDNSVEVRAAVLYALGTFFGASSSSDPNVRGGGGSGVQLDRSERDQLRTEIGMATSAVLALDGDASPLVRKELVVMLSAIVREWRGWFVISAWAYAEDEKIRLKGKTRSAQDPLARVLREWAGMPRSEGSSRAEIQEDQMILSSCSTVYTALLEMSVDPYTEVASLACTVVDYLTALLLDSAFMVADGSSIEPSYFEKTPPLRPDYVHTSGPATSTTGSSFLFNPTTPTAIPNFVNQTVYPFPSTDLPVELQPAPTPEHHGHHPSRNQRSLLRKNASFASRLIGLAGLTHPSTPEEEEDEVPTTMAEIHPPAAGLDTAHYKSPYLTASTSSSSPSSSRPKTDQSYVNASSASMTSPASSTTLNAHRPTTPSTLSASMHSSIGNLQFSTLNNNTGNNSTTAASDRLSESPATVYPPCTAAQVIFALVEEDMERLIIRRQLRSEAGLRAQQAQQAGGPEFDPYKLAGKVSDLGLGLVAKEVKDDILPLKSGFFDWSCEYYTEPQMRPSESEEPGSVQYNQQLWRRERHERIDADARTTAEKISQSVRMDLEKNQRPSKHPWKQIAKIQNDHWAMKLSFNPYEEHLAVSDENHVISVWDYKQQIVLNKFSNGTTSSPITSLRFINEVSAALCLTATATGSIRLFRNYDRPGEVELATAFRAVTVTRPSENPTGTVTAWDQLTGQLYVGGDTNTVKIWDAHRELAAAEILTGVNSPLTSLSTETDPGLIFVAGFGDGQVRLYDPRCNSEDCVVRSFNNLTSRIREVKLQQGGQYMVAGSSDGQAAIWDFRNAGLPVHQLHVQPQGLSNISTHSSAPFSASLSVPLYDAATHRKTQHLDIHYLNPSTTQGLTPIVQTFLPASYLSPTYERRRYASWDNAMVFHPKELLLAVGGVDSSIRILAPEFDKWAAH
ncbi:Guanine nucleotide binding protein MIP1 [Phaffia rhodozyma]|uniref:Guanine nucleotide binding protein MIP1 n=1 Tax=Phaffia rhodozyma TaxID=264483 RepID=A0A0F7SMS4_PHARH|nr:Guanine nucleotide binding protein MIP1 [Phaffia rhodozyma]